MSFYNLKAKKIQKDSLSSNSSKPVAAVAPSCSRSTFHIEPKYLVSQFDLNEDELWNDSDQDKKSTPEITPKRDGGTTSADDSSEHGDEEDFLPPDNENLEDRLLDMGLRLTSSPPRNDQWDEFIPDSPPKTEVASLIVNSPSSPSPDEFRVVMEEKFSSPPLQHHTPSKPKQAPSVGSYSLDSILCDIDLKPLGINAKMGSWLEEINQHEGFLKVSEETAVAKLENNLENLKKTYIEVLEKVVLAYEKVPIGILEKFPDFDCDVFKTLRMTRCKLKAKIIQTGNLLKKQQVNTSNIDLNVSTEKQLPNGLNGMDHNNFFNGVLSYSSFNHKESLPNINSFTSPDKSSAAIANIPASVSYGTPKASSSLIDYTDVLYKTPAGNNTPSKGVGQHMRNDGATGEFDKMTFPHSSKLLDLFQQLFGLRSFRTNQLQVVNAALLGHDCFVLMPTGGGKSLCYQLPAVVSQGVTVVVSPLRSLILDQVTKLLTLDIPAGHLSGDLTDAEASQVYSKLNQSDPALKLLYVTPEKLNASSALKGCLMGLYKRKMLARFVIDEVHCVSQWGHDFRPDYKKLKELREKYPGVNIMALTATATPRVRTDILHQLKITNPKWFLSSFNRFNLTYSVREKKGNCVKEIAALITKDFIKDSGVIYCLSRNECESVARELKVYGVNAIAYHAGLGDKERSFTQTQWMKGVAKVVCATIAFGMGIDKLDVRFVIHYSLPKSIEGYYQESGRAGRDGEKALCILYYAYKDKVRLLKLIHMDKSPGSEAAKKIHVDNLFRVAAFAENRSDCRRALQLEYFGEKFDRKLCIANRTTACDNCLQRGDYTTIDATEHCKAIVTAVKNICGSDGVRGGNFTMLHFVDVFRGSKLSKILSDGHDNIPLYGMGKTWLRLDAERIFRKLLLEEYLKERLIVRDNGITLAYLKVGRRADELLRGNVRIMFETKKANARKSDTTSTSTPANNATNPKILSIQENCYEKLREIQISIATAMNCNPDAIISIQAIRAMSVQLPETQEEMLTIDTVTRAGLVKFGEAFLDVTKKFAKERRALMPDPPQQKPLDAEMNDDHDWLTTAGSSSNSPYFDTQVSFSQSGGRGKRKRKPRGGPKFKRSRGAASSRGGFQNSYSARGGGFGRGSARGRKTASSSNNSGASSSGAPKFNTLMELPTNTARFPRPKAFLSNL